MKKVILLFVIVFILVISVLMYINTDTTKSPEEIEGFNEAYQKSFDEEYQKSMEYVKENKDRI